MQPMAFQARWRGNIFPQTNIIDTAIFTDTKYELPLDMVWIAGLFSIIQPQHSIWSMQVCDVGRSLVICGDYQSMGVCVQTMDICSGLSIANLGVMSNSEASPGFW